MIIPFPKSEPVSRPGGSPVPEDTHEHALERLLGRAEPPGSDDGAFVAGVMRRVQRQQRLRRTVLLVCSLVGALFGALGATLLSGRITWLFTQVVPGMLLAQVTLFVIAALAFYTWFMNDELKLER
jgi:hypothetical protein